MSDNQNLFFILPDLNLIPRKIHQTCFIYKTFHVRDHLLGEGSYGKVFLACKDSICEKVAKIITFDFNRYPSHYVFNMFFGEALITKFAGDYGFGIPVEGYTLCRKVTTSHKRSARDTSEEENDDDDMETDDPRVKNFKNVQGLIIMDRFDNDLYNAPFDITFEMMQRVFDLVRIMHGYGILHRDLFLRNIMYKESDDHSSLVDLRIIDFGLSIAFGQPIPAEFQAIDYLNVVKHLRDKQLKSQCIDYILTIIGEEAMSKAIGWRDNHQKTCGSEYSLLEFLPPSVIANYGPATVDLMVWSVKCDADLDEDIVGLVKSRVRQYFKENNVTYWRD